MKRDKCSEKKFMRQFSCLHGIEVCHQVKPSSIQSIKIQFIPEGNCFTKVDSIKEKGFPDFINTDLIPWP